MSSEAAIAALERICKERMKFSRPLGTVQISETATVGELTKKATAMLFQHRSWPHEYDATARKCRETALKEMASGEFALIIIVSITYSMTLHHSHILVMNVMVCMHHTHFYSRRTV